MCVQDERRPQEKPRPRCAGVSSGSQLVVSSSVRRLDTIGGRDHPPSEPMSGSGLWSKPEWVAGRSSRAAPRNPFIMTPQSGSEDEDGNFSEPSEEHREKQPSTEAG